MKRPSATGAHQPGGGDGATKEVGVATLRRVKRRYRTALALIALASVTTYAVLSFMIAGQASDGPILNVAGRQRMLSQRTTLLALQVAASDKGPERDKLLGQLRKARALFERSHRGLIEGDEELKLPGAPSSHVSKLYESPPERVDSRVKFHLAKLDRFLASPDQPPAEVMAYFRSDEPRVLLKYLNEMVGAYEKESAARVTRLEMIETGILLFTLLLLLIEARFIFRPLGEKLAEQIHEIEARRAEAVARDRRLRTVLATTGDALIVSRPDGAVDEGWSACAEVWFPDIAEGKALAQVLFPDEDEQAWFAMTFGELVEGVMPEALLLDQMPKQIEQDERTLGLSYRMVRDEDNLLTGVLTIVRDITAELAQAEADRRAAETQAIIGHLLRDRITFQAFMEETSEALSSLCEGGAGAERVLRVLHTLKGNVSVYGFGSMAAAIHEAEDRIPVLDEIEVADQVQALASRWRDELARIENLLGLAADDTMRVYRPEYDALLERVQEGGGKEDLLGLLRTWKLEPIRPQLQRLAWQIDRLAQRLDKEVQVVVDEQVIRCDGPRFKGLWGPLVHLARNAVDHGVESSAEREAANKPARATITLAARVEEPFLVLSFQDDGAGIDEAKLRAKAEQAGIEAASLTDLVFAEGLSSRDEASLVSGRGVGMSAVREAVAELGGRITVNTERGRGTTFEIRIPHRRTEDNLHWPGGKIVGTPAETMVGGRRANDVANQVA